MRLSQELGSRVRSIDGKQPWLKATRALCMMGKGSAKEFEWSLGRALPDLLLSPCLRGRSSTYLPPTPSFWVKSESSFGMAVLQPGEPGRMAGL